MTKIKWVMKQYWRIGTIRALLSLALGMFVLGKGYYSYIPFLEDLGLIGALILGSSLVLLFLGIGWLYDEKGKMWSPKLQAVAERNPYQYIPNYKSMTYDYQALYGVTATMSKILKKTGLDSTPIDELAEYIGTFFKRRVIRGDIFRAEPHAEEFNRKHTFIEGGELERKQVPLSHRLKLGFETELLRLNWIQSLTGLFQDVLVFGELYVTVLFPDQVTNGLVPIDYLMLGILFLSLPLFLFLTAAGWYYDKKLRVWSADIVVKFERDPYMYLPDPRNGVVEIPFFLALFRALDALLKKQGIDEIKMDNMIQYLETYKHLDASKDQNMEKARKLRKNLEIKF